MAERAPNVTRVPSAASTARHALVCLLLGIVAGALAVTLEKNPAYNYSTLLYLSFATGSVGMWTLVAVVITYLSPTPRAAFVRVAVFLVSVVATYYGIRYANFVSANYHAVQATAVSGAVTTATRFALSSAWPVERWYSAVVALAGALFLAGVCANIRSSLGSAAAFWIWAAIPLFILVFEAWCYFIPMTIYQGTGLVPAVVDTLGTLVAAALLVRMRSQAEAVRSLRGARQ